MEYTTPKLRDLGSLSYLTLGAKGSCADGGSMNDQNCQGPPSDDNNGQGR